MTPPPPSVIDRLRRGFLWICLGGTIVLILFVGVDFDILTGKGYAQLGPGGVIHEMIDHVVFPLVVLMAPLLVATLWMIRVSLEPLSTAATQINGATGQERDFRVETGNVPVEALPFVDAVNSLLGRLDDAARRQEGFAADVAHELKTPLAIIALELEALHTPQADRIRADVASMNRLIEQLLVMAQLDAYAASPQPFRPVMLDRVATDIITLMAPIAAARGVSLALENEGALPVSGRPEALGAALRNLLENATRVTPSGGTVTVITGPGPLLRVRDGGPGLEEATLVRLCQRYNRGDHASSEGAGLGLAIVARVIEVHGGRFSTSPEQRELAMDFAGQLSVSHSNERQLPVRL